MFSRLVTQWLVMRARSSRRRSPWNLLLVPAVLVWFAVLAYHVLLGLRRLDMMLHAEAAPDASGASVARVLVWAGTAVAALLPAFLLANLTVWLVPGARRAMDREAADHPGTGFRESMLGLLRGARVLVPLGLAVAVVGVLLS